MEKSQLVGGGGRGGGRGAGGGGGAGGVLRGYVGPNFEWPQGIS